MADNFTFKDASGASRNMRSTDQGGIHRSHMKMEDSSGNVIDPISRAENSPSSSGNEGMPVLVVRQDTPGSPVSANGDYTFMTTDDKNGIRTDVGSAGYGPKGISVVDSHQGANVNIAAAGTYTIAAPGPNKQIWVYGAVLKTNGTTATVQFQSDAGGSPTNKSGVITLTDNDGFVINPSGNFEMPWIKGETNETLDIVTTGSGTVDGIINYAVVDVS